MLRCAYSRGSVSWGSGRDQSSECHRRPVGGGQEQCWSVCVGRRCKEESSCCSIIYFTTNQPETRKKHELKVTVRVWQTFSISYLWTTWQCWCHVRYNITVLTLPRQLLQYFANRSLFPSLTRLLGDVYIPYAFMITMRKSLYWPILNTGCLGDSVFKQMSSNAGKPQWYLQPFKW